jgi:hypothetical protein
MSDLSLESPFLRSALPALLDLDLLNFLSLFGAFSV